MENVRLAFENGDGSLSVRHFRVEETLSGLFRIHVRAVSLNDSLSFGAFVGHAAELQLSGTRERRWRGLCVHMELVRVSEDRDGLATYELTLAPTLWRLTQRQGNRLFQHQSIPEIVTRLLEEWGIAHEWRIAAEDYPKLELRTQYGETDYAFVSRLLEEAGVTFWFADEGERDATLVLGDAPQANALRPGAPLPFVDETFQAQAGRHEYVTRLRLREDSRPGAVTLRDHDFWRPRAAAFVGARADRAEEAAHEQYHYTPGAYLREVEGPAGRSALSQASRVASAVGPALGAAGQIAAAGTQLAAAAASLTPVADDLGTARFRDDFGERAARIRLEALRADRRVITFETGVNDISPGAIVQIADHPREDVSGGHRLLVTAFLCEGETASTNEWRFSATAVFADQPYRPARVTPKPRIYGVQTAVVVGPGGQAAGQAVGVATQVAAAASHLPGAAGVVADVAREVGAAAARLVDNDIYVDEHGRVRVQFPWDREGRFDARSSIWMRVSQGWAGGGYGMFAIPRVGHEVLVAFVDGDPDAPIIVGRVHNAVEPVPFKLPENKTVSTWRSASSPGGEGFNEIRFEDAVGREMIFEHAQRDRNELVRNDRRSAVGGNNTRLVKQNDNVSVGGERTKVVGLNELEAVGLTSTEAVGVAKNTIVGGDETHLVGSRFSVTMARGLTSRFAKELGRALSTSGAIGGDLNGPIGAILGRLPTTALGGLVASAVDGPLADLVARAQSAVEDVLKMVEGYANDPGPPPTSFEMTDRKIRLSTGEATILLDGPNISLFADGNIMLHAKGNVGVLGDGEAAVAATGKVLLQSRGSDLILMGGPDVHLNPFDPPRDRPHVDEQIRLKDRVASDRICPHCGSPMVADPDAPGRFVCSAQERLGALMVANMPPDPGMSVEPGELVLYPEDLPALDDDDSDDTEGNGGQ